MTAKEIKRQYNKDKRKEIEDIVALLIRPWCEAHLPTQWLAD